MEHIFYRRQMRSGRLSDVTPLRFTASALLFSIVSTSNVFAGAGDAIFADGFEPPVPVVDIMDLSIDEGDAGTTAFELMVTLSNAAPEVVSFDYATSNGSAQAGSDYSDASGTVELAAGITEAIIAIDVSGDICLEDAETFNVSLSNLSSNALPGRLDAVATIANDDPVPLLSITADPPLMEGSTGSQALSFTVELDRVSCTDVQVDYATADGSANGGDDYTALTGNLTMPAFSTTANLDVLVNGDICVESDEQFTLGLSGLTPNADFANHSATGGITNDDPLPIVDLSPLAVNEGASGTTPLGFPLTLDRVSCTDTQVDFATADLSATEADNDYQPLTSNVTIPAFSLTGEIVIQGVGDGVVEDTEQFQVNLLAAAPNVARGISSATGTLINDDFFSTPGVSALNDTGITTCATYDDDGLACNDSAVGTDLFPNQDAENGRDFTSNADGDGAAGFQFTKLDGTGVPLVDQTVDYATTPWSCVRDDVTGLIWEVKTNGALSGETDTYSWFNGTGFFDGGFAGVQDGGECLNEGQCDTGGYIAVVNGAALCGITRWRLPTRTELLSLVHYGAGQAPRIDLNYFPNTLTTRYWTSQPVLGGNGVTVVEFTEGSTDINLHGDALFVRLVAGEDQ